MKTSLRIGQISGLLILPLLVSCGDSSSSPLSGKASSNPLEKYPNMKSVPVTDQKSTSQTVIQPDLFTVDLQGSNQINTGNFIEGQSSETLIRVTSKSNKIIRYTVEMTDFSATDRPVLTPTAQANIFSLKWTPAPGTIPTGQWGKAFKAQIQLTVVEASDHILVGVVTTKSIDLTVSRNNTQPKITGRSDLSAGIDEGQNVPFSIDVEDPGTANNPRLPEIQITPYLYTNTESYSADGSSYVTMDPDIKKRPSNPERISGNKWRFYYVIYIDRLPLDRDRMGHEIPSASSVHLCFLARAVSVIGTQSDQQQVCTTARYAAQPPTFTFLDPQVQEVKAGAESVITVKVSGANPASVISVSKPSQWLASLKGKKEIACDFEAPEKKNSMTCVIKWTPACVSAATTATLSLKADNTLGNKVKTGTSTKELSVTPDLATCPVTQPTSKTVEAKKPAGKKTPKKKSGTP
jgi:hypothetical protein